jgi:hypothetical protein
LLYWIIKLVFHNLICMFQRLVFFAFLVAILSSCSGLKKTTQSGADYPDFVWGESAGVRRNEQKPQEVEEVEYQTELNNEIEAEAIDLIKLCRRMEGNSLCLGRQYSKWR